MYYTFLLSGKHGFYSRPLDEKGCISLSNYSAESNGTHSCYAKHITLFRQNKEHYSVRYLDTHIMVMVGITLSTNFLAVLPIMTGVPSDIAPNMVLDGKDALSGL